MLTKKSVLSLIGLGIFFAGGFLYNPALCNPLKSIATGKAAENALYLHASPYLDMHGKDPVRWQEWNEATLQQAREQNKLLFVSSGYFSCHWCHVMQRESYQNEVVAKLLNDHFIPVKVDRELNSALDTLLIDFTERTQGQAGWPLNVFVTPEGYPLIGMTYVPADRFTTILEQINTQWLSEPVEIKKIARAASIELSSAELSSSKEISAKWLNETIAAFNYYSINQGDEMQGGFGEQLKFPNVPKLQTLLEIYARDPSDPQIKEFLILTLDNMASQGLWDQLGGGFYRYTVDPGWQVPHFEKMLYDNALLARLYFRAAEVFANKHYRFVATQTLDFIARDLNTPSAAFAASLSAVDDKGVEGGYYLWQSDELKKYLSKIESSIAIQFWGVHGSPDLEHGHHFVKTVDILQIATEHKLTAAEVEQHLRSVKKKLLKVRAQRNSPKDEKVLTAWNALSLTAFVAGARQDRKYKTAARELVQYFKSTLWDEQKKELSRAHKNQSSLGPGTLEDYAYTAQALLAWWHLDKNQQDEQLIEQILLQAWQRFYGEQGWILAENMLLKYGSGATIISDGPLPSPSSVLVDTTYQFAQQTHNKKLKAMALGALSVGHKTLREQGYYYATQISALLKLELAD